MAETQSPLCKAVKNRILELCEQKDLTINALATESGLPPSSIKNILYGKSKNPKLYKHIKQKATKTLRKEVVSLYFYPNKTNDTLHKDCESVIVGYIL